MRSRFPRALPAAAALAALHLVPAVAAAQAAKPDPGSRQIWDQEFVKARPAAKSQPAAAPAAPASGPARARSYVGVTVWRLKPAPEGSRGVTITGEGKRWAPARSSVDSVIPEGQQVRIAVEVSRAGYLYVVDRERYADGSLGEPVLVFPTQRLRGGEHTVQAGRVIEIPDLGDQPPYFTLKRSRPDHVGEQLVLLVTSEPLPGVSAGQDAQPLPRAMVDDWMKRWATGHRKLETPGGVGKAYTASEQEAGSTPSRLLTRGEPLPQTLYRVEGGSKEPTLIVVPLRFAPK
jgi:hypothetical protein